MTTTMNPTQTYDGELLKVASTASRDAMVAGNAEIPVGWQIFDTTLGQPLWWDGAAFVDATGNAPVI